MKFEEIKNLKIEDLLKKSDDLNHQILESKMKLSMQRLPDPLLIRRLRKDRARVQMVVRQKIKQAVQEKNKKVKEKGL